MGFLMMRTIREAFDDRNNQEALFTSASGSGSDLEWTIMRPGGLTVDPPTGVHQRDRRPGWRDHKGRPGRLLPAGGVERGLGLSRANAEPLVRVWHELEGPLDSEH